ncbi:hypothetical protein GCM10027052_11070 [Parafrigoribacterium mesophilum]|uniref:DUF2510 domain-containing protein n=1 Tax=Parafrigoribacterium mesophilum TaxID=433646 RepID=UPI0031FD2AF0
MCDAPTNLAPAGWYADTSDAGQERWWDGSRWTDRVRPTPLTPETATDTSDAALPTDNGTPVQRYRLTYTPPDDSPRTNTPATLSLIFGIISLIVNPLLLVGIAALILGIVGLRRAGNFIPPVGHGKAMAGVVLSIIGTLVNVILIIVVVSALIGSGAFQSGHRNSSSAVWQDQGEVQQLISTGIHEQTGAKVDAVQCAVPAAPTAGTSFDCIARIADAPDLRILVRVQDNEGRFVWQVTGKEPEASAGA